MAGKANTKRKDSNRMVLKVGESQRKDGSYSFRWTDEFGKRNTVYASSLIALREKENTIVRNSLDGIKTLGSQYTLNTYADKWFALKRGIRDSTATSYASMYRNYMQNTIGEKTLSKITFADIKLLYIRMSEEQSLGCATIKLAHILLNQILDSAVAEHFIRENPAKRAYKEFHSLTSAKSEKKTALTAEEQSALLSFVKNDGHYNRWYNLFVVMFGTGLRIGEITALTWDDIDFKNNSITISKTLTYFKGEKDDATIFHMHEPKTVSGKRLIPMACSVKEALLNEKERQEFNHLKCKVNVDGYSDFCFINKVNKPHTTAAINEVLRNIVKRYNSGIESFSVENSIILPPISCHTFRHTFATRMFESGVDIKIIQEILGHSSYLITMDIYTDVSIDIKQKHIYAIDDFIA